MTTVREALAAAGARLEEAGVTDGGREAAWLLAHLLGCSAGALRLRSAEALPPEMAAAFADLVARRASREPIQYILGMEEFLGLPFRVSPAVLIPRPDTEALVRGAAALLEGRPVTVADIGTGSGAIAVGLAHLLPQARVVAVDIAADALAVAWENATANGVADRVEFRRGDLVAPLEGERFDAILSNPPYIAESELPGLDPEVREWEPHLALTPGRDDLLFYRRLVNEGLPLLTPDGFLAVEVGHRQSTAVSELFAAAGLRVTVLQDTAGIDRSIIGRR